VSAKNASRSARSSVAAKSRTSRSLAASPHSFGFLDETGTLHAARDPFFAVGLLRCAEPYMLLRPLQRMRDREHFYDEIKWNKVSAKKMPILKAAIDVVFDCMDAAFSAFIVDKQKHDVIVRFGGQFEAYDALSRQLIKGSIRRGEVIWVIADEYSTPPTVLFEEHVRDCVNREFRRQAVAGVCRMRSSGVDLLQLADILLGAVVFDHKIAAGIAHYKPKRELLEYMKYKAGVASFVGGYQDSKLNIREYVA
jgi:hypothetical protein